MKPFLDAITIATLFCITPAVWANEGQDVSLAREVDQYLEKSASKWDHPSTLRPHWSKGLVFESSDGGFKLKIGGRLMWDSFWGTQGSNDFGGAKLQAAGNGSFFRRIRLFMSGTVYSNVVFKVQMDFGKGATAIKDIYVGLNKLWGSGGTLLLGNAKEPFSIYELTSSKYIQLIERPMVVNSFAPSRHTGLFLYGVWAKKRAYTGLSVTWGESDGATGTYTGNGGGGAFTFRVAGLALHDKDKKTLLHLGFSGSYRHSSTKTIRYRARPEIGNAERVVDTGSFAADAAFLWDFEVLFIWKSFDIVAEFMGSETDGVEGGESHSFFGWYVEIGFWITGESKKYSTKTFAISRTSPKRNFRDGQGGWGAWQIVFRYDFIDLNDKSVAGGETTALSAGVNWHWNPNTRIMFNLVYADVKSAGQGVPDIAKGTSGELFIFVIRVQFDF